MKEKSIHSLLEFTKLYHKFQQTKRFIYAVGEDRKENDAEHSFQVALTCWYLNNSYNLKLNMEKVLKYALAHDLLELYTGDFYFDVEGKDKQNKVDQEKGALEKLKNDLKEFPEISQVIEYYDNKVDSEAKFVNAVEKFIPVINIYLDNGKTWKEEGMTYQKIVDNKDPRISISEIPDKLWKEFKPLLKESELLS